MYVTLLELIPKQDSIEYLAVCFLHLVNLQVILLGVSVNCISDFVNDV